MRGFLWNLTGPFLNRQMAHFYPGVDTMLADHAARPALSHAKLYDHVIDPIALKRRAWNFP